MTAPVTEDFRQGRHHNGRHTEIRIPRLEGYRQIENPDPSLPSRPTGWPWASIARFSGTSGLRLAESMTRVGHGHRIDRATRSAAREHFKDIEHRPAPTNMSPYTIPTVLTSSGGSSRLSESVEHRLKLVHELP
jgi:hypothetical protein